MQYEVTSADSVIKNLWQELTAQAASGGFKLDTTNLASAVEYVDKGALLALNWSTRLATIVKTAVCITGGAADAPRVGKNHLLEAGDIISDGKVAATISSITTTESTYDTLNLSVSLIDYAADDILVEASVVSTNNSEPAIGRVEEAATKYLDIADPSGEWNGVNVALSENTTDDLDVSFADWTLSIKLADTTTSKNTAALIEAAIQALGITNGIVDFTAWTATGTNWTAIDGDTVTTAADITNGGRQASIQEKNLATALLKAKVKIEGVPTCSAIIAALEIKEANLPYAVSDLNKVSLGDRFMFI